MKSRLVCRGLASGLLLVLAACGGGSEALVSPPPISGSSAPPDGSAASAFSSGTITGFGNGTVQVNAHAYATGQATLFDDDTGASTSARSNALEVGMVPDVKAAASSDNAAPVASELHLHPLARGSVDASDTTGLTLTVMAQSIQLSSATVFSDHRACVQASSSPCTAITAQSGLSSTSGSTPGSYVTVHGYLLNSSNGSPTVMATLVSVADAPTGNGYAAAYKVEGTVTAVSGSQINIGALTVNLGSSNCRAQGASTSCAGAFTVGTVASVFSATAPTAPVQSFNADTAIVRGSGLGGVALGTVVELEGAATQVSSSPAGFNLRGVQVDASALPTGTSLPVAGDVVRITGSTTASGISATNLQILRAARTASFNFEADVSQVASGSSANTYQITLLGQSITVNSNTWLADFSSSNWTQILASRSLFTLSTFQAYLAASSSQHLVVHTAADASGQLTALSLVIVPPSSQVGIDGTVDASPAPSTSSQTGTPSLLSVHGVAVNADPAATVYVGRAGSSLAAGGRVLAWGQLSNGALTVNATQSPSNVLVDYGAPSTPSWMGH